MVQQICVRCGKTFEAKIKSAKYCPDCKKALKVEFREKEKEELKRKQLEDPANHKICPVCGKHFFSTRKKCICCSEECKKSYLKQKGKEEWDSVRDHTTYVCEICGKSFTRSASRKSYKFCSKECIKEGARRKTCADRQAVREAKMGSKEGYDYVICPICGKKFKQISMAHLRDHHNLSVEEFKSLYPDAKLTCTKLIEDHLVGENNPGSKSKIDEETIRKRSPYCLEFWIVRGKTKEDYEAFIEKERQKAPFRENACTIEYYTKRGYSEEEAKKIISTKTISNGLDFYIKKYGEEEGRKLYSKRIKNWADKTFLGNTRSNKADTCIAEVLFGFEINEKDFLYGENEYRLFDIEERKLYDLDLLNVANNKVIEFHGDYWHCNPKKYKPDYINKRKKKTAQEIWDYDKRKIEIIKKHGFEVMIIWESDYDHHHDDIIKKAKEFLFENYEPSK